MSTTFSPYGTKNRQSTSYTEYSCLYCVIPTFYMEDNLEFSTSPNAPHPNPSHPLLFSSFPFPSLPLLPPPPSPPPPSRYPFFIIGVIIHCSASKPSAASTRDFLWALGIILSRGVSEDGAGGTGLVPYLDLTNHGDDGRGEGKGRASCERGFDEATGSHFLRTLREVEPGGGAGSAPVCSCVSEAVTVALWCVCLIPEAVGAKAGGKRFCLFVFGALLNGNRPRVRCVRLQCGTGWW